MSPFLVPFLVPNIARITDAETLKSLHPETAAELDAILPAIREHACKAKL